MSIEKAIVQEEYGDAPEGVLRLADVARPTIGDDEILVVFRLAFEPTLAVSDDKLQQPRIRLIDRRVIDLI